MKSSSLDYDYNIKNESSTKLFITLGFVLLFFVEMAPVLLYVAVPCLGAGGFTLL